MPARRFESVAADVLDDELVVRQVDVEGADHVVAIAECVGDVVVELVSGGLGVADQVEPVPGPALAVVRAGEQPIDQSLVGVGCAIGQEGRDVCGRGRKPGQVEREAADQGPLVGFGAGARLFLLERGQDEAIDRVARPARTCADSRAGA